jgi:hypothetical protein
MPNKPTVHHNHDPEATARAIAHFEQAYRTGERPADAGAIELAIAALYTYRRMQLEACGRRVTIHDYAEGELDGNAALAEQNARELNTCVDAVFTERGFEPK